MSDPTPAPVTQQPTTTGRHSPLGTAILAFLAGDVVVLAMTFAIYIVAKSIWSYSHPLVNALSLLLAIAIPLVILVPVMRKAFLPRFGNNRKLTAATLLISITRAPILWLLYNLMSGLAGWLLAGESAIPYAWVGTIPYTWVDMMNYLIFPLCSTACYIAVTVTAIYQVMRMAKVETRLASGSIAAPAYITPWEQATCGGTIWDPRTEAWALATIILPLAGMTAAYAIDLIANTLPSADLASSGTVPIDFRTWSTAWLSPSMTRMWPIAAVFTSAPAMIAGALSTWRARTARPGLAYISAASAACLGIIAATMAHMSAGAFACSLTSLVPLFVMILSDRGTGWNRTSLMLTLVPVTAIAVACTLPAFAPLMIGAVLVLAIERYATVRCNEAIVDTTVMPSVPTDTTHDATDGTTSNVTGEPDGIMAMTEDKG